MAAKNDAPVATLEPDTVIVVYDPKTGAVRHVHQEATLPGGTAPSPEKQMERAIAFAREHPGRSGAQLKAMHIAPPAFRKFKGIAFAFDVKAGVLVEREGAIDALRRGGGDKPRTSRAGSGKPKRRRRGQSR